MLHSPNSHYLDNNFVNFLLVATLNAVSSRCQFLYKLPNFLHIVLGFPILWCPPLIMVYLLPVNEARHYIRSPSIRFIPCFVGTCCPPLVSTPKLPFPVMEPTCQNATSAFLARHEVFHPFPVLILFSHPFLVFVPTHCIDTVHPTSAYDYLCKSFILHSPW
jgi:hypothetical protein